MKDNEEFSALTAAERRELIIAELKRKSRIRTLLRGLPLDEVREIIDRMEGVLNELEEEYKKREEAEKEKRDQAKRIMSDMESCGVDINLLNEMFTCKSEPDNAKYSKDGVPWSGQGRRPDAFKGLGPVELERYRIPHKK
ncbi:DNA-binding protein (plasmid) [Candidatus Williamhamiltonella defendens]|uniref:DNA-binding protein n=1 Tax=Candidatus Williamhamiltonella defendens TaxID=138072 RepID=A0A2D3TAQ7_9ENTR|nr:H-NS histone family protein [Candidatus Hamiltonella defensa]ATW30867.1 DNA-binding protein [Candidatus Hamiltonella defensa]ATW31759.1 DNA-binding protein [Candidatus Hamiltonella defensa]ATW32892.1 DNA-binding protein [Candidatus Hamiltonella defensa]ATW34790.1 DNA-binding protein [Candidatus Hamiltonella defensa]AYB49935.1 DNA-binding protein [Candidatus Hamiltonella defensa]